jgi:hypothetical protein
MAWPSARSTATKSASSAKASPNGSSSVIWLPICVALAVSRSMKATRLGLPPVPIERHAHDLPARARDRKFGRARETAVVIGADRPRGASQRGRTVPWPAFSANPDWQAAAAASGLASRDLAQVPKKLRRVAQCKPDEPILASFTFSPPMPNVI